MGILGGIRKGYLVARNPSRRRWALWVGAWVLGTAMAMAAEQRVETGSPRTPLRESVARYLRERGWPDSLTVATISMLPIIELRGAIPVAIHVLGMPWWRALPVAVVGNLLPVPLILGLLGPISRAAARSRAGHRFFEWLFARTRRKTAGIEKYEMLGLTVFVAIPLPATGAWTGAMAAFLLGIGFTHAIGSILLGVVVAGVIVTVLSLLGFWGAVLAAAGLLSPVVAALWRLRIRSSVKP